MGRSSFCSVQSIKASRSLSLARSLGAKFDFKKKNTKTNEKKSHVAVPFFRENNLHPFQLASSGDLAVSASASASSSACLGHGSHTVSENHTFGLSASPPALAVPGRLSLCRSVALSRGRSCASFMLLSARHCCPSSIDDPFLDPASSKGRPAAAPRAPFPSISLLSPMASFPAPLVLILLLLLLLLVAHQHHS